MRRPKPHTGAAFPLTPEVVEGFMQAADERRPHEVPTIYDLVALCDALKPDRPIQAMRAKRTLYWLMKTADKTEKHNRWDHPWRRS